MKTIFDVHSNVRVSGRDDVRRSAWTVNSAGSAKLVVAPYVSLQLPKAPDGLELVQAAPRIGGFDDATSAMLRTAMLSRPAVAFPLITTVRPDRGKARRLAVAVAVQIPGGDVIYGAAKFTAVEGGLGFGQTLISDYDDIWSLEVEAIEQYLAQAMVEATDDISPRPDPGQAPWKRVVVLLGPGRAVHRRGKVLRALRLAAGLQAIQLDVRPDPDGSRIGVLKALKSEPPDCLLIWDGSTVMTSAYEAAYMSARPSGHVDSFSAAVEGENATQGAVEELCMHLQLLRSAWNEASDSDRQRTWDEVGPEIIELESDAFQLTDRLKGSLGGNPYPYPDRMFEHVQKLSRIAEVYRERRGDLGNRLSDFAMAQEGIEIALTDSNLKISALRHPGVTEQLFAKPHVKVDDAKSPDKVGRIYFALDSANLRFVVDHIGLHDYGAA